jgi:hypothetical protein
MPCLSHLNKLLVEMFALQSQAKRSVIMEAVGPRHKGAKHLARSRPIKVISAFLHREYRMRMGRPQEIRLAWRLSQHFAAHNLSLNVQYCASDRRHIGATYPALPPPPPEFVVTAPAKKE